MDKFVPKKNRGNGPEAKIQSALEDYLKVRDWFVQVMHGNLFQFGVPDMYIAHRRYGARWVEVKNPLSYRFTPAQLETFPRMAAAGVGVWVLIAATESEYRKLFAPANWHTYLMNMRSANV